MHSTHTVHDITTTGLLSCEAYTIIKGQNLENYDMYMNPKYNDMYMNTKYYPLKIFGLDGWSNHTHV